MEGCNSAIFASWANAIVIRQLFALMGQGGALFGRLARPSASPCLPQAGEFAEVVRPELVSRSTSALVSDDLSGRLSDLAGEVIDKGKRGA